MKKTGKTAAKSKTKSTAKKGKSTARSMTRSTTRGAKKTASARKKTRATVKKSVAKKRKTAKKSTKTPVKKKAAAKKRTASSAKKTARKRAAPKSTKRTAKKKSVSKTAKRKPAPKKRQSQKPVRKATPKKRRAARMIKPKGNGLQDGPGLKAARAYQIKKGEAYMNPEQVKHFNQLLLDWKKELMKEVDRTVDHMKSDATNFADPADRATQEEEFNLELRTRDRERKLIKKIDDALGMIDMDEYGFCSTCGAEIGVRRLEARPTATLCIDCKALQEIKERQLAD